jgi:hypothetical protein
MGTSFGRRIRFWFAGKLAGSGVDDRDQCGVIGSAGVRLNRPSAYCGRATGTCQQVSRQKPPRRCPPARGPRASPMQRDRGDLAVGTMHTTCDLGTAYGLAEHRGRCARQGARSNFCCAQGTNSVVLYPSPAPSSPRPKNGS